MTNLHPLDDYHSEGKRVVRKAVRKLVTRPVVKALLNATVWGGENVADLEGAYIVVGNHSSHLDAPMVFSLLPDHMTEHLAAGAAADYFYRKRGISKLTSVFFNTYPIERKGKHMGPHAGKAAGMTGRLLRDGIPILIFPEGTRSRDGKMGAFKPGAAALSIKIGVPIVPLAMSGGHDAMPVGRLLPNMNHPPVELYIGRPMFPRPDEDAETFIARVRAHIIMMLDQKTANPDPQLLPGSSGAGAANDDDTAANADAVSDGETETVAAAVLVDTETDDDTAVGDEAAAVVDNSDDTGVPMGAGPAEPAANDDTVLEEAAPGEVDDDKAAAADADTGEAAPAKADPVANHTDPADKN